MSTVGHTMKLLEGAIMPEQSTSLEETIQRLEEQNDDLREQLRDARNETAIAKREAGRALSALRKQLNPLYQALQMVYGELDAVSDDDAAAPTAKTSAVWEQWKQKLDKGCSKAIDALLMHGEMTRRQLAIACGYSPQNVSNIVSKLNGASLIVKNGDRISLRKL